MIDLSFLILPCILIIWEIFYIFKEKKTSTILKHIYEHHT
ncbi:hypothetical protein EELLY_v1c01020 [Entomoplasma ellychniae]|uniref:Uncharacterized protein n=1 Tax=Entomoplasma ellychniae TaxID=2114 RepID=A0A8E2UCI3_9MOLU|nr:hypothetical protein EELLY_v1c01020 [Entomoplasma ellychniae]